MYFTVGGPDIIEEAEVATEWPRDCLVCQRERGKLVPAANRRAALTHRNKEHPWLADILREHRNALRRAVRRPPPSPPR